MAIKEIISGAPFPGIYPFNTSFGLTSYIIDAAGEKVAMRFFAPKSGTLDAFEFRVGTVANTSGGVRVSFQGIDSSGNPDGTISAYRDISLTSNSWITPGLMTSDGTDTGTPLTVTRGQSLFCVIEFVSFASGDSVPLLSISNTTAIRNIYISQYTGTWAHTTDKGLAVALRYSDGSHPTPFGYNLPLGTTSGSSGVKAGNNPDERGLIFSYPAPVLIGGAFLLAEADDTCEFRFYNPSVSSNPLEVFSQGTSDRGATNAGYYYFPFTKDWLVDANNECIISILGTGTGFANLNHFEVPSSSYLEVMEMGVTWRGVTRTAFGAWTENAIRRPLIHPIITGLDHEIGGQPQVGFQGTP